MGNVLEAGIAWHHATGERQLLDVAIKLADHLCEYFMQDGPAGDLVPGHPGIEFCLVKLYRETGQDKYLKLAQHFLDKRGIDPEVLEKQHELEWDRPPIFPTWNTFADHTYMQIHAPVRQQTTAEGHAVRASYLYAGMADVYMVRLNAVNAIQGIMIFRMIQCMPRAVRPLRWLYFHEGCSSVQETENTWIPWNR